MAKTNLLKTNDVTFLDLIGNGKKYHVPAYQRDYSWEQEQWEDLWNDIEELLSQPEGRHYMGALVVESTSDRDFQIVDGQQRIATLSILALAVIATLQGLGDTDEQRAANQDRARRLRERFIGEKDPASLQESSKLFLNETDDGFYQDYLVQLRTPLNPRRLPRSNRLLWECFGWFRSRLASRAAQGGEALASLLSETVARQLLFILITVEDDLSAYVVFETLNARGLELSSTDLLKNFLFSRVQAAPDLAALQRRWKSLVEIVRQERFPDFLRYHLLCDTPQVRKQRLFKLVQGRVRTPAAVFALMDDLERRAELFAALNDADHEYWLERRDARPYVRELILFRVRQTTPLLFAAFERFEPADFVRVLKLLSVVSFRYTVVSGLNTNELEPVYHRAAKAVLDGRVTTPAEVFAEIRGIYVGDEAFERDFGALDLDTSGQRKRLVKYVLCKLESDASGVARDYEADTGTIEHILPENPGVEWDAYFDPQRQAEQVYRLGNLTLLEASLNRQVGNQLLAAKRALYAQSGYTLTRAVAGEADDAWSPAALARRQAHMARRAAHVWRSDFE
jgi:hypothetical protein